MNFLIRAAIPVMRAIGKASYVGVFQVAELKRHMEHTGFDIVSVEDHASKGVGIRPYIVAFKT